MILLENGWMNHFHGLKNVKVVNNSNISNKMFNLFTVDFTLFRTINDKYWNIPVSPDMKIVIEQKLNPTAKRLSNAVFEFYQSLKEEMVEDLKYFKSLENEVESLQSQLETQQT
ncbi:hypothetical protein Tco_0196919 [Tanacetum coccineum]